jgi:hypothetical protein
MVSEDERDFVPNESVQHLTVVSCFYVDSSFDRWCQCSPDPFLDDGVLIVNWNRIEKACAVTVMIVSDLIELRTLT